MKKMPLDLSKFKKVKTDAQKSTFQSPEGHTVTVAHERLSPTLKAQLEKIPIMESAGQPDQEAQHLADGGDVENQDSGRDPASLAVTGGGGGAYNEPTPRPNDATPQEHPGPTAATGFNPNADKYGAEPPVGSPPLAPTPEPVQEAKTPNAILPPEGPPSAQPVAIAEDPGMKMKTELTQDQMAWENDLANGHIKPETYHDLFAKKDTVGKVATIFGLMAGGFGALAGQPNAALAMMDKEIEKDLEAQKASKTNAQNFLRLNQTKALNDAQIKHLQAQVPLTQAQAELDRVEAHIKSYAQFQAQTLQTTYHQLVQRVASLPEGPQKEAEKKALALVYSKMGDKINNINDSAAGASQYYNMLIPTEPGAGQEQQFQNQNRGMRLMGPQGESIANQREQRHVNIPGITGNASRPLTDADHDKILTGVDFDQKLGRFIDWTKAHNGSLNLGERNKGAALAAELQGAYRQATHGGVYKEGEQNFIGQLIDSTPTKFFNQIRVIPQLQALQSEHRARMNNITKDYGLGYQGAGGATQTQPQYKTVNGVKYMRGPNGEAIQVK